MLYISNYVDFLYLIFFFRKLVLYYENNAELFIDKKNDRIHNIRILFYLLDRKKEKKFKYQNNLQDSIITYI